MENHFDKEAQNWDKNQTHIKRTDAIAAKLPEMVEIRHGMKALEFGAGTGLLSFAMKDQFAEITLMDSSIEMINVIKSKIAEAKILNMKPLVFDLEKNNYNGGTFDITFSQMVLHHIEDIEAIIKKFYSLLNPKGILAIADLYKENGTFHDFNFKGHFGFDPDILAGILSRQRFNRVNYRQCFIVEKKTEEGFTNNYPVFLMTGIK